MGSVPRNLTETFVAPVWSRRTRLGHNAAMPRLFCLLLLLLTSGVALGVHLGAVQRSTYVTELQHPLAQLAFVALVGRVLLSLLPPGHPGEHRLGLRASGGFAATWAASHALGLFYYLGLSELYALLGHTSTYTFETLAILALGLLALMTGPGDLVPRHDEAQPRSLPLLGEAVLLVGLVPLVLVASGELLPATLALRASAPFLKPMMAVACFPAGLALLAHAMNAGGLAPRIRQVGVLGLALAPGAFLVLTHPVSAPLGPAFLAACTVAAGGHAWLRRADRRGALLALVSSLALAWVLPVELLRAAPPFALAGLVAVAIATPDAGRKRIARPLLICMFLAATISVARCAGALPEPTDDPAPLLEPLRRLLEAWSLPTWGALFLLADIVGLITLLRRPWRGTNHPEPVRFFSWMLAALTALLPILWLLLFGGLFGASLDPAGYSAAIILMAPSALLLIAINGDQLGPRPQR